jgi:hypothetical protein
MLWLDRRTTWGWVIGALVFLYGLPGAIDDGLAWWGWLGSSSSVVPYLVTGLGVAVMLGTGLVVLTGRHRTMTAVSAASSELIAMCEQLARDVARFDTERTRHEPHLVLSGTDEQRQRHEIEYERYRQETLALYSEYVIRIAALLDAVKEAGFPVDKELEERYDSLAGPRPIQDTATRLAVMCGRLKRGRPSGDLAFFTSDEGETVVEGGTIQGYERVSETTRRGRSWFRRTDVKR